MENNEISTDEQEGYGPEEKEAVAAIVQQEMLQVDGRLRALVAFINDGVVSTNLVVLVGGRVISGRAINIAEYEKRFADTLTADPTDDNTGVLETLYRVFGPRDLSSDSAVERIPYHIHFKDAVIWTNGSIIKAPLIRIKLSEVQGFVLGGI